MYNADEILPGIYSVTPEINEAVKRSTAITYYVWNAETLTLLVTLIKGNRQLQFANVPASTFAAFKDAESQGRFFRSEIVGKYDLIK